MLLCKWLFFNLFFSDMSIVCAGQCLAGPKQSYAGDGKDKEPCVHRLHVRFAWLCTAALSKQHCSNGQSLNLFNEFPPPPFFSRLFLFTYCLFLHVFTTNGDSQWTCTFSRNVCTSTRIHPKRRPGRTALPGIK